MNIKTGRHLAHPEVSLCMWAPLPDEKGRLRDPLGVTWTVEWRSADGSNARLRAGSLVRLVTRERASTWERP